MDDQNWKEKLTPEQYKILREKGTEMPGTGKHLHNNERGMYKCAGCGHELFKSDNKFDSGTGWPSFDAPINNDAVTTKSDNAHGMSRIEVLCPKCGGHLGHVFPDGPTDTGQRYCINSCALKFEEK